MSNSYQQGFHESVLSNIQLRNNAGVPILHPGGTVQDQKTIHRDIKEQHQVNISNPEPRIFGEQITYESIERNVSWLDISEDEIPSTYGIKYTEKTIGNLRNSIDGNLKRFDFLKLRYADDSINPDNTRTPRVLTRYDNSKNSLLTDTITEQLGKSDDEENNFSIRLFAVEKESENNDPVVLVTKLNSDELDDIYSVIQYELDSYSPETRWEIQKEAGVIVFYGDYVPDLSNYNFYCTFTRFVGITNVQPTLLDKKGLPTGNGLFVNSFNQVDTMELRYDTGNDNFTFGTSKPNDAYRITVEGNINVLGKIYTFGREFEGGGGGGGGDVPLSLLNLEKYLTKPPNALEEITTSEYVDISSNTVALNQLDAIGKQIDIIKGIDYDIENEGSQSLYWALNSAFNLPYIDRIEVQIRDNTLYGDNDEAFIKYDVLDASSETFTVRLADIVRNDTYDSILNPVHNYSIRVIPKNHASIPSEENITTVDISLLSLSQESIYTTIDDYSMNWTTPYKNLRPGSVETVKQWIDGDDNKNTQTKRTIRMNNSDNDISNAWYVNIADNVSVRNFIQTWRETRENKLNTNRLYTNIGYFGRSLESEPDLSNLCVIRPFAAVWYDNALSESIDFVSGRMSSDISDDFVKFNDTNSENARIRLAQNGVWSGYPYENKEDEFAKEIIIPDKAGYWGRNVLAGLDTQIVYGSFVSDASDNPEAFVEVELDSSFNKAVSFTDVSNLDSWTVQDLSDVLLRHNTTVGEYRMSIDYETKIKNSKLGRKRSIFYRDGLTGDGLTTIERNGEIRSVGINQSSVLPYYIGVIVNGRGVDGNLAGMEDGNKEDFLFAKRVFVDDLRGMPQLNTFVMEYNIWRTLLNHDDDSYIAPMVKFCCGVPSLVGIEARMYSEIGNVCGTILPEGGKIATYEFMSSITPSEGLDIETEVERYLENQYIWKRDISTNSVATTYDITNEGTPYEWSADLSSVLLFSDSVMNKTLPIMRTKMYSLNYPDGVIDYGSLSVVEEDLGQNENALEWIHSDARSYVGRFSERVSERLFDAIGDVEKEKYTRIGGIGGVSNDLSNNVVSLADNIWNTTTSEDGTTWILGEKFKHDKQTIKDDELLFYGGAFVNGNAVIKNGIVTRPDGTKLYYIDPRYSNPYDLVSHIYNQYIGSEENPGSFEKILGENYTSELSKWQNDLSGVEDISGYKETGSIDLLLDNDFDINGKDKEYKWVTKRFITSTEPGNERKMIRCNYSFDISDLSKNGYRLYTKQRLYYSGDDGGAYDETSWFASDSSLNINVYDDYGELLDVDKYKDSCGNIVNGNQYVFATNTNVIDVIDGKEISDEYKDGYSEIFVRVGIPVSNNSNTNTLLYDLELFDANDITLNNREYTLLTTGIQTSIYDVGLNDIQTYYSNITT